MFCFFIIRKKEKETQFVRIVKLRHAVGERRSYQASRTGVGSNEVPALIAPSHITTYSWLRLIMLTRSRHTARLCCTLHYVLPYDEERNYANSD